MKSLYIKKILLTKVYWLTFVFFAICASLGGIPETSREVLNISLE